MMLPNTKYHLQRSSKKNHIAINVPKYFFMPTKTYAGKITFETDDDTCIDLKEQLYSSAHRKN